VDRDRVLPLALALLAVVALALAAATLDSAVVADGAGLGGDGSGIGGDDGNIAGEPTGDSGAAADRSLAGGAASAPLCLPALREPPALLVGGLLFAGLFAVVYRSTRSTAAGTAVCGAVGLPVGLLWVGLASCGSAGDVAPPPTGGAVGEGLLPAGGGGSGGAAGAVSSSTPLIALFVTVAVAVVLVALLATGSDGRAADETSDPDEGEEPAAAVGRVAAAAADRIADGDADAENEVYRAWRRMTERLDVASPETTTPREFRRAAVEAGMDREDVAALTRLFESVRYGDREPTDDRERRAVETFRRLRPDDEGG
jgi:hypothetical protein